MRMETIATNIANAETTRGPDGQPYKRRTVQLEAATALGAPPSYPPLPLDQGKDGVAAPDPSAAWQAVHALKPSVDDLICVTGSFFLLGQMRKAIETAPLGVR